MKNCTKKYTENNYDDDDENGCASMNKKKSQKWTDTIMITLALNKMCDYKNKESHVDFLHQIHCTSLRNGETTS